MTDPSPPVSVADPRETDPVPGQAAVPSDVPVDPPGAAVPADAVAAAGVVLPPAVPMRPAGRYQHAFWFALLLATALTLAGTSLAIGAYAADAMPETVVRAYFAALQRGDAAAALGYGVVPEDPVIPDTDISAQHDLLTPTVLAAQNAIAPIQGFEVRQVHRSGDTANVDVSYTIDLPSGRQGVFDSVPVRRNGHGWQLDRSAVPEVLSPGPGSALASIAGSAVPRGQYDLFPGVSPVRYDTPNLELGETSRVVRFFDSGTLPVDAEVSAAGRRAIVPSVDAAVAACLAGRSAPQTLCPVPEETASVPGSLRGSPTGSVARSIVLRVESTDGEIDISGSAPVAATYQRLDDNNIASTVTTQTTPLSGYCYATTAATVRWNAS
jgi:hypothetical protein